MRRKPDPKAPNSLHSKSESETETETEQSEVENEFLKNRKKDKPALSPLPAVKEDEHKNKMKSLKIRTITTFAMFFSFVGILCAGHFYCAILVVIVNFGIFREILKLKRNENKDRKLPFFFLLHWYFFFVCIFFMYSRFLRDRLELLAAYHPLIEAALSYNTLISFLAYLAGFCAFVLSLQKGQYKYQFQQFGWTHVTLVLVVCQSSSFIANIYDGLIWFFLPCFLVITNDCWAYLFGFFFGRTPLIQLSPKKTWEGFIGGFFATLFFGFILAGYLCRFDFFICSQPLIHPTPFQPLTCQKNAVFVYEAYSIPALVAPFFNSLGMTQFWIAPVQWHALVMGTFAALIAPFGGFFASGFKRAFKIKDFGDSIPGHGGITDRMDCQVLMGMFSYLYVHNLILRPGPTVTSVLASLMTMTSDDQLKVFADLQATLVGRGLLKA
eukprot:GILI01002781.1.p1 GENE.GILI01002781.1~~GILI01002781.1.p1  ORF type:complete len:458 (-),score=145.73 GILI01002781.1:374-1693(-)